MNQVSYTLSNTYMGGNAADAVLGDNSFSNVTACQGAVSFNVGRQYTYSAALYQSLGETCGTQVFVSSVQYFIQDVHLFFCKLRIKVPIESLGTWIYLIRVSHNQA